MYSQSDSSGLELDILLYLNVKLHCVCSEQAGGKGSDGQRRILDIVPSELHQRLPLFLGSRLDIDELESYGDVQQLSGKKYNV